MNQKRNAFDCVYVFVLAFLFIFFAFFPYSFAKADWQSAYEDYQSAREAGKVAYREFKTAQRETLDALGSYYEATTEKPRVTELRHEIEKLRERLAELAVKYAEAVASIDFINIEISQLRKIWEATSRAGYLHSNTFAQVDARLDVLYSERDAYGENFNEIESDQQRINAQIDELVVEISRLKQSIDPTLSDRITASVVILQSAYSQLIDAQKETLDAWQKYIFAVRDSEPPYLHRVVIRKGTTNLYEAEWYLMLTEEKSVPIDDPAGLAKLREELEVEIERLNSDIKSYKSLIYEAEALFGKNLPELQEQVANMQSAADSKWWAGVNKVWVVAIIDTATVTAELLASPNIAGKVDAVANLIDVAIEQSIRRVRSRGTRLAAVLRNSVNKVDDAAITQLRKHQEWRRLVRNDNLERVREHARAEIRELNKTLKKKLTSQEMLQRENLAVQEAGRKFDKVFQQFDTNDNRADAYRKVSINLQKWRLAEASSELPERTSVLLTDTTLWGLRKLSSGVLSPETSEDDSPLELVGEMAAGDLVEVGTDRSLRFLATTFHPAGEGSRLGKLTSLMKYESKLDVLKLQNADIIGTIGSAVKYLAAGYFQGMENDADRVFWENYTTSKLTSRIIKDLGDSLVSAKNALHTAIIRVEQLKATQALVQLPKSLHVISSDKIEVSHLDGLEIDLQFSKPVFVQSGIATLIAKFGDIDIQWNQTPNIERKTWSGRIEFDKNSPSGEYILHVSAADSSGQVIDADPKTPVVRQSSSHNWQGYDIGRDSKHSVLIEFNVSQEEEIITKNDNTKNDKLASVSSEQAKYEWQKSWQLDISQCHPNSPEPRSATFQSSYGDNTGFNSQIFYRNHSSAGFLTAKYKNDAREVTGYVEFYSGGVFNFNLRLINENKFEGECQREDGTVSKVYGEY